MDPPWEDTDNLPSEGESVWAFDRVDLCTALQDKDKIRHKKRWSQIMYMYYLLGYKLMELPISDERKDVIAEVKIFQLLLRVRVLIYI